MRIFQIFSSRAVRLISVIFLQIFILVILFLVLNAFNAKIAIFFQAINILVLIAVINRSDNPTFRLTWAIIILSIPLVGGLIYLLLGNRKITKSLTRLQIYEYGKLNIFNKEYYISESDLEESIKKQYRYIEDNSYYPACNNTCTKYFSSGESAFESILKDLKEAKHFIFIETFIIKPGFMWDSILSILKEKVLENVQVYVLYDDFGCINSLSYRYDEYLRKQGINCAIFNPVKIKIESKMNNRNHKKNIVIDNKIAYIGGFNLADEYINVKSLYGKWKDAGIKITGEACYNCTIMFLQFYNAMTKEKKLNNLDFKLEHDIKSDNYCLPFSDSPTDSEDLSYNMHLNMLANAKKSIYIYTPYLVIDYTITQMLKLACKNGVKVVMVLPYIPDKYYISEVTRSNYYELVKNGVTIYEYLPGFLHSKVWVVDEKVATVGTVNMDYRSYYLNFECSVLFNDKDAIETIVDDFNETIKISKLITIKECQSVSAIRKFVRAILNIFAPLM